ncbi:MAG: DUF4331 domain-containing protein [Alphaproteobacteria bacterium]|nr:DUF4331 domain-containing protein [Alphaproteobacteria bacterium]
MSSHREAPEISKDPVADNTDVYAFVSPDNPNTVTLIANFIPLEGPAGGPNFYEFGDDVLYQIHIDNDGDGDSDISYQFRFETTLQDPNTFLYNTGPIGSLTDPNWNKRQLYSVTRVKNGRSTVLAEDLASPPCNIGPFSTPNYATLAQEAIHVLPSGETVFAGQRAEGFYVDLGSVFDLVDLRPFQDLHINPLAAAPGVNGTNNLNVHTLAIQLPKSMLTRDGSNPTDPTDPRSVIGVYASASRRKARILERDAEIDEAGPWVQVSRLGSPLFNEVMIPLGLKDFWNSQSPKNDKQFLTYVQNQEVPRRLVEYYPGVFPDLAAYNKPRADMVAIFLTGIPAGVIPGFQNFTGQTLADLLRLNMAIPLATAPNILGILGGDLAGFPNGRRVVDDVFTIELRALAGVTIPLVDPSFTPDAAASVVTDGITPSNIDSPFLASFPYLGIPYSGFDVPS